MKNLENENAKLKKTIKKLQALHRWRRIALKFRNSRRNQTLYKDFMEYVSFRSILKNNYFTKEEFEPVLLKVLNNSVARAVY